MKKVLMIASGFVLMAGIQLTAWANAMPSASTSRAMPAAGHGACKNIAMACKAAGYVPDHTSPDKNIRKNCMRPIMMGQTVAGVTINPADIQACRAMMEAHRAQARHRPSTTTNKQAPTTNMQTPAASQ